MKKHILSSVFALLMMFCLTPEARAEEFCALGSHSAGTELNCYITTVSGTARIEAQGLPEGLYITETPSDTGKALDLRGTAMNAGHLDFSLTVSEAPELISCSVDIEPALPLISTGGDKSCTLGSSVSLDISASTPDSGILSYQWYAYPTAEAAYAIMGAIDTSYTPDTSAPGRFAYCCEVTNTNNGISRSAVSPSMYVTVSDPVLEGVDIHSLPQKLRFAPGDALDTRGLSLVLRYDNGSTEIIEGGFEASPAQFNEAGRQLVELRYEGHVCYYEVEVSLEEADVEGIGVLTLPDKTEYEVGDSLETEGLTLRAYTANGQFDVTEGFRCSPSVFKSAGRQSVSVEYAGKRCSFTVHVEDSNELKSIAIASLPTRREYAVGDGFDPKGLSLQLIYGGRTEIVSSGFDCSPKELTKSGPQEITVRYEGHSVSFSINVKDAPAKPSESPRPSESPAVESVAPSQSPAPNVNRDHQAKELNGLVKIIFFAAVASLIGLGAYVFYMQKKGKR